ncbi:hypothetical protein ABL840_04980 [Variovorax sp. NFACC27]|uniref:hypothetical protein n=1 Tax=unclassified Variovorax TaxID=663243 RepID=UPI000899947C|nr:hypothetical protein SAMN03159371_00129 [Variovorax sp. NFACC28]SEF72077.1 hypothetical protein SAMN03159365_00688 [Variovorax sp. NFACC29]SFB77073.1 hypothetical protein SAMN03159379_00687 [Variovorax sp. NFACC26]SFG76704.1 hypothetical protein SAMN03159447_04810 [Variovorax sp. NFACC27]
MKTKRASIFVALLFSMSLGTALAGQTTVVKGPNGQKTTVTTSGGTTTVTSGGTRETNHDGHSANVKRVRDMYDRER